MTANNGRITFPSQADPCYSSHRRKVLETRLTILQRMHEREMDKF